MTVHSAVQRLHAYGRRYPGVWDRFAILLAGHADRGVGWSSWCYAPAALANSALFFGGGVSEAARSKLPIPEVAGLAAWRATQGIYRIHPALLEALLQTPIDGAVPTDVLMRMPEWCVYVETSELTPGLPGHLAGFFAYLECNAHDGHMDLVLLLDFAGDEELWPWILTLTHTGIGLHRKTSLMEVVQRIEHEPAPTDLAVSRITPLPREAAPRLIEGMVSVLLYLCSEDAEVPAPPARPVRVVRGKKRPIMPTPSRGPRIYECGARIGPLLAAAKRARSEGTGGSLGHSVIPHIRRAHWHTYWTGPRDGERAAKLRWLHPIRVNLDPDAVPEVAVIRRVDP